MRWRRQYMDELGGDDHRRCAHHPHPLSITRPLRDGFHEGQIPSRNGTANAASCITGPWPK